MKTIIIGDIHGRDDWKKIKEIYDPEYNVVFLGDYFDSFTIKAGKQKNNFSEIMEFATNNSRRVKMLIGNHDLQYMYKGRQAVSGYQKHDHLEIGALLDHAYNNKLMEIAHSMPVTFEGVTRPVILTHAGVTKRWYDYACKEAKVKGDDIVQNLRDIFTDRPDLYEFLVGGGGDPSGDDTHQSPLWVRPDSLIENHIEEHQTVGHTPQGKYPRTEYFKKIEDGKEVPYAIVWADILEGGHCLEINNDQSIIFVKPI